MYFQIHDWFVIEEIVQSIVNENRALLMYTVLVIARHVYT